MTSYFWHCFCTYCT